MEGLNFYLLGPPYVTWNNSTLDIPRRQVRSLLYYLATYPNAIPKERLHYLFWNDKPEAVCRRNLSHLLTHVRRVLPDEKALIVRNSLIMLDHEKFWCDVVEFKRLLQTSRKEEQYLVYQRANELYRGPFLEGMDLAGGREFEYLIERERFYLERNHLNLLYKLILIEKRLDKFENAIEYAYQYLAIDDLSEEVHRQLIKLHHITGKRERAISQYKTCEALLWNELQAKPSKNTWAVYQEVITEKRTAVKKDTEREEKTEIRRVTDSPTYISKEYLDHLNTIVNREEQGPWGITLICGELGIGKSSLIKKYLANFGQEKLVLETKCNPGSHSIRYWPIRQICLEARKSNHPVLKNKSDTLANIKKCLLRLSEDYLMSDNGQIADTLMKENYFALFTKFIFGLADAAEGVILCFEDLEWADEETLDLILYLCSFLQEKNILILGSYCCEENKYLKNFIHNVQLTNDFLGIINLPGIDLDTTLTIMKYWLGEFKGDQLLAEKLYRISGGNPFFLSEILRWILEAEISVTELLHAHSISLPTSISKAVRYRLSRLSKLEMKILETAAIIGYSFDFDQIFNLIDIPKMDIFDALDELIIRHLLENHSSTYQFRHDLIYQSVLEKMNPARKQYLEQCLSGPRFR